VFDHQIALQLLELLDLGIVDKSEFDQNVTEAPLGIATLLSGRLLELLHGNHLALDREATEQGHGLFCTHRPELSVTRQAAFSHPPGNYRFARRLLPRRLLGKRD